MLISFPLEANILTLLSEHATIIFVEYIGLLVEYNDTAADL
jgi:hypothetical protein